MSPTGSPTIRLHVSMRLLLAFIAVLLCSACSAGSGLTLKSPDGTQTVEIPVEIADTPEARSQGLKDRDALPDGEGLLIAFPESQVLVISTNQVKAPFEAMFFNERGEFVSAETMEACPPEREACPSYQSPELAQYLLLANPGLRERHGIRVGWRMDMKQVSRMVEPE